MLDDLAVWARRRVPRVLVCPRVLRLLLVVATVLARLGLDVEGLERRVRSSMVEDRDIMKIQIEI